MPNNSLDFFNIDETCQISYCSLVILLISIIFSIVFLIIICIIRRKIIRNKLHRIQIKKAPQKNSSEVSIFPKKKDKIPNKTNLIPKEKKPKFDQFDLNKQNNAQKTPPNLLLTKKTKQKAVCVTDRTANKPINNYMEDKVLSENLQVEYFEEKDVNTDMTTVPKEKRGLDKNNSGFDFLNFSNNGDVSEKNFENFMKLKNKQRMFNNDDSIEFEDVDNIDMNQSEKSSFKIENKLEIHDNDEILKEFVCAEPKITRHSEPNERQNIENMDNSNLIRNYSEGVNPYLQEMVVHNEEEFEENMLENIKNDGLEIVNEVNEESDRDKKF